MLSHKVVSRHSASAAEAFVASGVPAARARIDGLDACLVGRKSGPQEATNPTKLWFEEVAGVESLAHTKRP